MGRMMMVPGGQRRGRDQSDRAALKPGLGTSVIPHTQVLLPVPGRSPASKAPTPSAEAGPANDPNAARGTDHCLLADRSEAVRLFRIQRR